MKKHFPLIVIFLSILCVKSNAQLTVNTSPTDSVLVRSVLLGSGVVATNIVRNGVNTARAEFNCNNCNLGFSHGILLTSGAASQAIGASLSQTGAGAANGSPADPQLTALANNGFSTFDAYRLEFDFSVAADSVAFNYVFGSEEYNDYVPPSGIYNDIFAFFISGPGIVGQQNIALLPGTSTAVAIWNVNNGYATPGTPTSGPCNNCSYFRDNTNQNVKVQYDGNTVVLTARAAVQPCETYHIKLAIADVGDPVFDSGVFLEANSFSSFGTVTITANVNGSMFTGDTIYTCPGQVVTLTAPPGPSYNWSTGATTQSVTVAPAVPTSYLMYENLGSCFAFSNTYWIIPVPPTATITPSGPVNLCPGDSVTLTANPGNSFQWSNGSTSQSITVSSAGTFTVTVTNGPGCSATSVPISVSVGSAAANIAGTLSFCTGSSTTLTANLGASYQWSNGDLTQATNITAGGNYTVTVTQAAGCTASATVSVAENPLPVPAIAGTFAVCQGQTATLNAGGPYSGYQWTGGLTSQVINPGASGTYTVTVTDANGCSASTSQNVVVNALPTPVISGTFAFCSGSNTNLNAGGPYSLYQWTGGAASQVLNVTSGGTYSVTVTDANGCTNSASQAVTMNPLPAPVISGVTSICQGQNTTLNAGGPYSIYQWNGGSSAQTINVGTTGTYTVTVTDANGCIGSATKSVTVNALPTPVIAGTFAVCQGQNATLNAGGPYTAYQWSGGLTSQVINPNTAGTYTVTVTDNNGCSASTSQNIVVNPLPSPVITGTFAFCAGGNVNLNAGGPYALYQWTGGAASQVLNVTAGGTYTVTVTNNFGCTNSTSQLVTMNALPAPVISGNASICQGQNTTLNAGGPYSIYQWNGGSSAQTINVNTTGTYTVTVTDANGCVGSATKNVTVNPLPTPVIAGTFVVCQGQNATLNAGGPYAVYQWSGGLNSQVINPNTGGTYTVTVTDNNGCSASTSQNVVVNPVPSPAISGTFAFCQGNNSTLSAGGPYSSYLWTGGSTSQTLNVTTGGNYTVTVSNSFGCTSSATQLITVNPLPNPVISGNDICAGGSSTLNAGNGYASYQWSNNASTQTISVSTGGTYSVTVTDNNGCINSTNINIVVNPLPVPVIAGINTICQGQNSTFNAGTGYSAYLWSNNATSQTININTAGTYTVTVTDANNCSASTSQALTVNPLPSPSITGNTVFCQGDNTVLDAGAGFTSYAWSNGATSQTINTSTGGPYTVTVTNNFGCSNAANTSITVNALPVPVITGNPNICIGTSATLNAGAGYVSYNWSNSSTSQSISTSAAGLYAVTVTDVNGCIGSTSQTVVVNALPTPVITGNAAVCQGTSTIFDAGTGYVSYLWSTGATTKSINVGAAATYTVTVTDFNACSNSTSKNLSVNALPQPVITGVNAVCDGNSSTLTATPGFAGYQWSTSSTAQSISVSQTGNYTVTVTDGNGCSNASPAFAFTANAVPVVSFTNDSSLTCEAPVISFTNTSSFLPGAVFTWNFGDNSNLSAQQNPSHLYVLPGLYTVSLSIINPNGCSASTAENTSVTFVPLPEAKFASDPTMTSILRSTVNFTDQSANAITWAWDFGDGSQSSEKNPAHSYNEIGDYAATLTVTNIAGCVSSYHEVVIINPFYVPSAFTPNGDGKNDIFYNPGFSPDVSSYVLTVWNRWGQKVFEADDAFHFWNGKDRDGKDAPQSTYVYTINVKTQTGKEFLYKGTVTLLR